MFKKILSQLTEKKSAHPLGSEENLSALISGIPVLEPGSTLVDVDHWLDDIGRFREEIGTAALVRATLRLDALAQPARAQLLDRYLDPKHREHLSEALWASLEQHALRAFDAYRQCLAYAERDAGIGKAELALCAARALHLWAWRKKLFRFRYRSVDDAWWQGAHDVLAATGRLGIAVDPIVLYEGDDVRRSAFQHYLAGVYFELAPLSNLLPQQLEALDRFLQRNAEALELLPTAGALSSHSIDLSGARGPQPLPDGAPPAGQWLRFLSRRRIQPQIVRTGTELRRSTEVPDWLIPAHCNPDDVRQLVMLLLQHWAGPPPTRQTDRRRTEDELKAVVGFAMARRMIACSDFARLGRPLEYEATDFHAWFEANRFGVHAPATKKQAEGEAAVPPVVNPLDVLEKLELAGDKQMMDRWIQTDISASGIGVTASGLRPKYRVGTLACIRYSDGLEWHMGIIRRIGRDAQGRANIGLEALPWPSMSASIRPLSPKAATAWSEVADHGGHGYLDAILASLETDQLILPANSFIADLELELKTSIEKRRIRLTELRERGEDFDLVRFADIK